MILVHVAARNALEIFFSRIVSGEALVYIFFFLRTAVLGHYSALDSHTRQDGFQNRDKAYQLCNGPIELTR